ncbi:MAG: hypothetical protein ABL989_12635 [Gammaproteobacteria bacterium]
MQATPFHRFVNLAAVILATAGLLALSAPSHGAPVSGQGTWETTLFGRNLDGNPITYEAWYDAALDITWLADVRYAENDGYFGPQSWGTANFWATNLNPYGSGITGWRLPTVTDTGAAGCDYANTGTDCGYNVNTATGEMAHMFYVTLGNLAIVNTSGNFQAGSGLTNTGPFANLDAVGHWSSTSYVPPFTATTAWYDDFGNGIQSHSPKSTGRNFWAVHSGDIAVIPLPAGAWLFGGSLVGLLGLRRRQRAVGSG